MLPVPFVSPDSRCLSCSFCLPWSGTFADVEEPRETKLPSAEKSDWVSDFCF